MSEAKRADRNFILWSLIPYIAARSGEKLTDDSVKFEEAATIRPDGGNNIVYAIVGDDNIALPDDYVPMTNWCGPMILHNADDVFWQVNSKWTDRASPSVQYFNDAGRILSLYSEDNEIPKYDYAWLCEMGYVKVCGDYDGSFKASWQIVQLCSCDINKRLLDIGDRIREKYKAEFDRLKAPYIKAVLDSLPKHIRRKKEYGLQFMFSSDGWFLLHCISCLLKNGKLKEPTEEQRKVLSTIIMVSTRE